MTTNSRQNKAVSETGSGLSVTSTKWCCAHGNNVLDPAKYNVLNNDRRRPVAPPPTRWRTRISKSRTLMKQNAKRPMMMILWAPLAETLSLAADVSDGLGRLRLLECRCRCWLVLVLFAVVMVWLRLKVWHWHLRAEAEGRAVSVVKYQNDLVIPPDLEIMTVARKVPRRPHEPYTRSTMTKFRQIVR